MRIPTWRRYLRFWRPDIDADVDDELRFHLEERIADLMAYGNTRDAAQAEALREFGELADVRDTLRAIDTRLVRRRSRGDWLEAVWHDLAYAFRKMRTAPGFAAAVIATLGLGIGAATAIFSVVDAVLLKPLPYPESDRLVRLYQLGKQGERNSASEPNFHDWVSETHSFSGLALISGAGTVTLSGLGEPVVAQTRAVSDSFFSVFRVKPAPGRAFVKEETTVGGPHAVIVSNAFWQSHLGANPAVIGRQLQLSGGTWSLGVATYTLVGVMPWNAEYPPGTDLWIPLGEFPANTGRTSGGYTVIGRLEPAVSAEMARRDVSAVSRALKQRYGTETNMSDATLLPLREQMVGKTRTTLFVLLAASGVLLIIACANAVNLLVARIALRDREMAVRVALGATRRRITTQLLAEALVLAIAAGAVGVLLAVLGVGAMLSLQSANLPRIGEVSVDGTVLVFAIAVSVAAALVLGVIGAWHGARSNVRERLAAAQRSSSGPASSARARRSLVVAQIALTAILLVGAGVLGESLAKLLDVNPGFRPGGVLVVDANPTVEDNAARLSYYRRVIERIRALPGVSAVGATNGVPLTGDGPPDGSYLLLDDPGEKVTLDQWPRLSAIPGRSGGADYHVVDGDYFAAMGIPIIHGRAFDRTDVPNAMQSAIVSASFAKHAWPRQDPIGKIVQFGNMDSDLRPFFVVGVAGDVRGDNLATPAGPTFYAYQPQRQHSRALTFVIATKGDPAALSGAVRASIRDIAPTVSVNVQTMEHAVAASVADRRFTLVLIGTFGAAALLLAMLGVYSVVSYLVAQRRQEIGVRIALGAQRSDVLRLVLRQGALLAATGVALGVVGSLLLSRLLSGLVYGVSTRDPMALGAVVILLAGIALIASYIPARRATSVDPIGVLRGS